MKRRDTLFRAVAHQEAARSIRYDDWPALSGGPAEIRLAGTVVQTGIVEVVMPGSSALCWTQTQCTSGGISPSPTDSRPGSAPATFNR